MNFYNECCLPTRHHNSRNNKVSTSLHKKNIFNKSYSNNNNINKLNIPINDITLMEINMKIDLLNNKVNQMNNAFSQINFQNLYNQKEKLKNKMNSFNNHDNNICSLIHQLKENSKNNLDTFNDIKNDKIMISQYNNYINRQKRTNSSYKHSIKNNSLFSRYDNYFTPLVMPSNQQKNNIFRNVNNSFNHKNTIQNKNKNKNNNFNKKNSYNVTHNHFSISHNDYPIKNIFNNSKILNFGSFDNYFIGYENKEKKEEQSNDDNYITSISNEKENDNNIKHEKIFNNSFNKNIMNNLINQDNKKDEKKDVENDNNNNYILMNQINDENNKNNSLKDDHENNNNDINNLIIDQKVDYDKKHSNNVMNQNKEYENNSNTKINQFSLINKLYDLGKKNEYNDKKENDNRNQTDNLNNKFISSYNYNTSPQENNNLILFNKFKDVNIDKKFINKNKQLINNKNENFQDDMEQIKKYNKENNLNLIKIKKKKNKKITFNEKENIFIKYYENDEITQIFIYDAFGRIMKSVPKDINIYLNKLKRFKPKSVLLNYNSFNNNNDIIQKEPKIELNNQKRNSNKKNNIHYKDNILIKSYSNSSLIISPKKNHKVINRYNSNDNYLRKREIQRKKPKKEICKKFKRNPQKFYTEPLCDLVLQSLDLDKSEEKNNNSNYKINEENNTKKNVMENSFERNMNIEAYNNLKKYFEENNFDV